MRDGEQALRVLGVTTVRTKMTPARLAHWHAIRRPFSVLGSRRTSYFDRLCYNDWIHICLHLNFCGYLLPSYHLSYLW